MIRKTLFISAMLLSFVLISCLKDMGVEAFDYEKDTPVWLKEKISAMATDRLFARAKVYRYTWGSAYIYHVSVPLSSCVYCELYDQSGNKVQITDDAMLQDFLNNRSNEVLIWERKT